MDNITNEPFSHAEWEVMRIIWTLKECTSTQIIDILNPKQGWKPSTVKTLLNRLLKKELISAKKRGRGFIYSPNIMEMQAVDMASKELFHDICAKDVGSELGNLIDHFDISKSDIKMLIEKLNQRKSTAPDKVQCDCLGKNNSEMNC